MKHLFLEIRLTAIAITLLLLVGWLTSSRSCTSGTKRSATEDSLSQLAGKLDGQVERGRYQRVDAASITDKDSWGRTIKVEYRDEGVGERLLVSSAGADGTHGTKDDITATRWLLNGKSIGERLHDGAASTAAEATKGVIDGVKDKFKKAFHREPKADTKTE